MRPCAGAGQSPVWIGNPPGTVGQSSKVCRTDDGGRPAVLGWWTVPSPLGAAPLAPTCLDRPGSVIGPGPSSGACAESSQFTPDVVSSPCNWVISASPDRTLGGSAEVVQRWPRANPVLLTMSVPGTGRVLPRLEDRGTAECPSGCTTMSGYPPRRGCQVDTGTTGLRDTWGTGVAADVVITHRVAKNFRWPGTPRGHADGQVTSTNGDRGARAVPDSDTPCPGLGHR